MASRISKLKRGASIAAIVAMLINIACPLATYADDDLITLNLGNAIITNGTNSWNVKYNVGGVDMTLVVGGYNALSSANKKIEFATDETHEARWYFGQFEIGLPGDFNDSRYGVKISADADDWSGMMRVECSGQNEDRACTAYNSSSDTKQGIGNFPGGNNNQGNNFTLSIVDNQAGEPGQDEPGQDDPGHSQFDGDAYLVWGCKNSAGVCYKLFENIPVHADGSSEFYAASTVVDQRTHEAFSVDAQKKGWILKDDFNRWVDEYKRINNTTSVNWATVDPNDIVGEPKDMRDWEVQAIRDGECQEPAQGEPRENFERCVDRYAAEHGNALPFVKLQPLPDEPHDNNAYVSYGDRNFKVVVYNSKFRGVTLGSLEGLNYYPASWSNAFIRQDQWDVSSTSEENPTIIDTVLLESTVKIKALEYNDFAISSIVPLNVPDDVIEITKSGSEYRIHFSSNFYDNVVFKVTDSQGKKYYIRVHRYTVDANLRRDDRSSKIEALMYFDKNKSYTDFDVTATLVKRDGSEEKVELSAIRDIDDGLGNAMNCAYECNEETDDPGYDAGVIGKGLKKSVFVVSIDNDLLDETDKVFINVEYKGSTANNYAGTFAGSGEGIEVDLRR